ncbi:MAG: TIGR01212 family radical SAM protein [Desulfobacterales bacterium]|nr:TIGR01212 family radical SAM protein [Desulfobacterales bacterium]
MGNAMKQRYTDFNTYLRNQFGCRVQKITLDAGFTCPNRDGMISTGGCIYCNPNGSGTGAHGKGISITDQIVKGKQALKRRYKAKLFMAYFQSFSNTYAPVEKLKKIYDEALSVDEVAALSIGTRPDCVNEPILSLLESYTKNYLVWIEYGIQSVHNSTLSVINRGHDFRCFHKAVEATAERGIKICAHIILGLPGEDRKHMLETAKTLADMRIDGIKIHLLYVIKGTKLEEMYRKGRYRCLEQLEYADLVCDFLEHLPREVIIQRLTGDPHPEELVAPSWALKKRENLELIKNTLEKRNSWQGKLYNNSN